MAMSGSSAAYDLLRVSYENTLFFADLGLLVRVTGAEIGQLYTALSGTDINGNPLRVHLSATIVAPVTMRQVSVIHVDCYGWQLRADGVVPAIREEFPPLKR